MHRRSFLTTTAASMAASAFADTKPKRVGLIGSGWYGKCDLIRLIQVAPIEVVSLCDVDKKMLSQAAEQIGARQDSKKKPRTFTDYRQMLKEKDLDICLIATPDHWHALNAIEAIQAGADLYLQKPISVDVVEGAAILAAARKHGRVVQIGTQRRSTPHLIEARDEFIKSGKLGKIAYAEICCYYPMRSRVVEPEIAPPEELDFDMWTGPAPKRPFHRGIHPRSWRAYMEYGNGIVGDMGVHMYDMVRWMLDLGWPTSVSSSGGILQDATGRSNISDTQTATFSHPGIEISWTHRTWGAPPDPKYTWGATIYGEKGTLKAGVFGYDFIPMGGGSPVHKDVTYEYEKYPEDRTERDLERHVAPAIRGHMKDLLANIGTRGKPVADVEQGFISSSACILANMSAKLGRSLRYDPATGTVKGDAEATKMLARAYRAPWVHPDPKKV